MGSFYDSRLALGQAQPIIAWRSGVYYGTPGTPATAAPAQNNMRAVPLPVPAAASIDRIGVEVTGAGGVGSVVRLGVYLDNGSGVPGELLFDAGAGIDGTSATGQAITVAQTLPVGLLWLAYVAQGSASVPTVRSIAGIVPGIDMSTLVTTVTASGFQSSSTVSGALPSQFGSLTGSAVAGPRVSVRAV